MVRKYVQIEFAHPGIKAVTKFDDLYAAAENASLNLELRHDVTINSLTICGGKLVVAIDIPDDKAESFSIGNHLRGMSTWLLLNRPYYKDFMIGKRLLTYVEIPGLPQKDDTIIEKPLNLEMMKLAELTEIRKELQNVRAILQSQFVQDYTVEMARDDNGQYMRDDEGFIIRRRTKVEAPLESLRKKYGIDP